MNANTPSPVVEPAFARRIAREVARRRASTIRRLSRFVAAESPSTHKAQLDRFARMLAAECRSAGGEVRLLRQARAGNHVLARFQGAGRARPIMILGHYDTVYPPGTLARMPFRVRGGRAFGPGAMDMKGGLAIALSAMESLIAARAQLPGPVIFLITSDEEVGSLTSRTVIEQQARRCRAVLVLEPAAGADGRLKTARKGVGTIEMIVHGRSAHAGLNPSDGVNAIHELALQIDRIRGFNDPARGTTVNAGIADGGTRANVIPERARATFDLRVTRLEDASPLEQRFHALKPFLPGARIEVHGGLNRPPLERTDEVAALFRHAQALGVALGLSLDEASVGGGSDGNFTGALGVPTLDGLGAVGGGAHSTGEFIFVRSLAERAALVALLLMTTPER